MRKNIIIPYFFATILIATAYPLQARWNHLATAGVAVAGLNLAAQLADKKQRTALFKASTRTNQTPFTARMRMALLTGLPLAAALIYALTGQLPAPQKTATPPATKPLSKPQEQPIVPPAAKPTATEAQKKALGEKVLSTYRTYVNNKKYKKEQPFRNLVTQATTAQETRTALEQAATNTIIENYRTIRHNRQGARFRDVVERAQAEERDRIALEAEIARFGAEAAAQRVREEAERIEREQRVHEERVTTQVKVITDQLEQVLESTDIVVSLKDEITAEYERMKTLLTSGGAALRNATTPSEAQQAGENVLRNLQAAQDAVESAQRLARSAQAEAEGIREASRTLYNQHTAFGLAERTAPLRDTAMQTAEQAQMAAQEAAERVHMIRGRTRYAILMARESITAARRTFPGLSIMPPDYPDEN
ncbi:MAG: hypothetical protein QG604_771 [Candidatus Dependentiae bacterium]|nr:hypothetical protein [Candidatus Dependentiae bacterium]